MDLSRQFTFDRVVRILGSVAIMALLVWLIDILKDVLLPFCVACLIAYMLEPIVEWQQKKLKLKKRILPVIITIVELTAVIALLCYFFIPSAIDEVEQLDKLVRASQDKEDALAFLPPEIQTYIHDFLESNSLESLLSGSRLEALLNKSTTLLITTIDFVMHTLEWLLTFIYVLFIMLDYEQIMRGFRKLVPPKYRKVAYRVSDDIKTNMNLYFRSQAVIALCAAVMYCIGFSIVGLPMAIIMGITVGILYMIPYFQYITLIPVAILCLIMAITGEVNFWIMLGKCGLVYVITQSVCDYVLTPKIMGNSLGLNPAIILLSLSIWGTLMGIIGMIIALPTTALLIAYYNEYVLKDTPTQKRKLAAK